MSTSINLKHVEQKAYRLIHEDGLLDLGLGVYVGGFALIPLVNRIIQDDFWSSMILLPVYLLVFLGYRFGKKWITVPRIGLLNYSASRKKKLSTITAVTAVLLFIIFLGGIWSFLNFSKMNFSPLFVLSGCAFLGFCLAAYLLALPRLFVYAVLTAAAGPVGEVLWVNFRTAHHGIPLTFGITALVMILIGIILLIRFFIKYPIPRED